MYNVKSNKAEEFIDDQEILETIAYAKENKYNRELIFSLIERAKDCKGLTHREAMLLLECEIPEAIDEMEKVAKMIKKKSKMIFMAIELFYSRHFIFLITVLMDVYIALIMLKINILLEKN